MVVKIKSIGILGMDTFDVTVETDISRGIPSFDIVGLPDASIKESRDRVRSAVRNGGFEFPTKKIVINLAPADVKKFGSIYDFDTCFNTRGKRHYKQRPERLCIHWRNIPCRRCTSDKRSSSDGYTG